MTAFRLENDAVGNKQWVFTLRYLSRLDILIYSYIVHSYSRRQYNRGKWLSRLVSFDYDLIRLFDYWTDESFAFAEM